MHIDTSVRPYSCPGKCACMANSICSNTFLQNENNIWEYLERFLKDTCLKFVFFLCQWNYWDTDCKYVMQNVLIFPTVLVHIFQTFCKKSVHMITEDKQFKVDDWQDGRSGLGCKFQLNPEVVSWIPEVKQTMLLVGVCVYICNSQECQMTPVLKCIFTL